MRLSKCPHKDAPSDQRNNSRNLNNSKLHDHIDGIAEDNHNGDNKHPITTNSLNKKQSNKTEQ